MDAHKIFMLVSQATLQTFEMVIFSTLFSLLLGLPLGILLCISDPQSGIKPRPVLYQDRKSVV